MTLWRTGSATRWPLSTCSVRHFHNYFVAHLPQSSLHPDSGSRRRHDLPRGDSTPHTAPQAPQSGSAAPPSPLPATPPSLRGMASRDLTVVRIPLRSARHHFGAYESRGSRPYNEDAHQAGTIDLPAFATRPPISLSRSRQKEEEARKASGEGTSADSASYGDPQVFYFAVFDGHGGSQCSEFLRDELHGYIEEAAREFQMPSTLWPRPQDRLPAKHGSDASTQGGVEVTSSTTTTSDEDLPKAVRLQRELVQEYRQTVGGYYRRFRPPFFNLPSSTSSSSPSDATDCEPPKPAAISTPHPPNPAALESVLSYAFLRADLDFITAQARKPDPDDKYLSDSLPLNSDEVLGAPHHRPPSGHRIGGPMRFKGGSTASVALISTPTGESFWSPTAYCAVAVAHVGDTRVLLCETATGKAIPLTSDHHPSTPTESRRLARFGGIAGGGDGDGSSGITGDHLRVVDSFGEERFAGLANSRSFGDVASKRLGVSAEPDIVRLDMRPAEYSFLVLVSDGVTGVVTDQEVVDVVKEARSADVAAKNVVEYAVEVAGGGGSADNATCLVVRLGGWERRSEGGTGSLGTKALRDARRREAADPRAARR